MEIKPASLSDLPHLVKVESTCFPSAEAASKKTLHARLLSYPSHFWLLWDNNTLIGFVNGMVTDLPDLTDSMYEDTTLHTETGAWQMIFGVNTLPAYRRRGCAESLLQQVIADSKSQKRRGLVLTCKEHLLHYYAKFGFVNEGISQSVHGNVRWYQMRLTLPTS